MPVSLGITDVGKLGVGAACAPETNKGTLW